MDIKKELEQAIYAQRAADRLEAEYLKAQKSASKKVEAIYNKLQDASKPLSFHECIFGGYVRNTPNLPKFNFVKLLHIT